MANRRMFSKAITSSAKFLKMPPSTQTLYFHLGLNADDDGVVEGFNIMRMIGSTEDELKILVAKRFVVVLNEDLVTFITDWKEHNLIRPDRKVDSIYKDLLLKVVSDAKLIESRSRADSKHKEIVLIEEKSCPTDVQRTDNVQHRVGKVRLGEGSLDKVKKDTSAIDKQIEDLWLLYPNKKGRKDSFKKIPKLIKEYSCEEIKRCVERYIKECEVNKTDKQYMKHGSTFFNSGYDDYLDKNYKDTKGGNNGQYKINNGNEERSNDTFYTKQKF